MNPSLPAHVGRTPAARSRLPPAAPCQVLRPAPDTDAWPGHGEAPVGASHRLTPAAAGGTAPRPGHDTTDTPAPPHRATPTAHGACKTVLRQHERLRSAGRTPRTPVAQGMRHRGRPHGTDEPWRARVQGNSASHTHPLCHGARARHETTDTPLRRRQTPLTPAVEGPCRLTRGGFLKIR